MAIILTFSISFYIMYNEQVYNLLLFSFILISVYQPGAGNSFSCCLVYRQSGRCLSSFGFLGPTRSCLIIHLRERRGLVGCPGLPAFALLTLCPCQELITCELQNAALIRAPSIAGDTAGPVRTART